MAKRQSPNTTRTPIRNRESNGKFLRGLQALKTYQCVEESSRNAVCVQAWAETMRVVFRNLGVTATHQGRSRTPLTVHVNMIKASGDASTTNADTKTPVHCAVRASAVRRICASSHDSFEPNHKASYKVHCPVIESCVEHTS